MVEAERGCGWQMAAVEVAAVEVEVTVGGLGLVRRLLLEAKVAAMVLAVTEAEEQAAAAAAAAAVVPEPRTCTYQNKHGQVR